MTKANLSLAAIGVILALWLVLFFSNRAVLVWFTQPQERMGMLKCQYFNGTNVVERQFLYSKQGFLGRDSCPRIIELEK